mgnify:CR=1 FL=1
MTDEWDDFSISINGEGSNKRQAFRARIPGLRLLVQGAKTGYAVRDLSALGLAFKAPPGVFRKGMQYKCQLFLRDKRLLDGLAIVVVRIEEPGLVGCTFANLDMRQEDALNKLVLEVQKLVIEEQKRREDE